MDSPPLHWLAREIPGHLVNLPLPLCWDADVKSRAATHGDLDDEHWFTAWDHGAIDPSSLVFSRDRDRVTCPDCLGWIHA